MKSALITGVTGQDGSYLTNFLLSKGYRVFGTYRRSSSVNFWRLKYLNILNHDNLQLLELDLTDPGNVSTLVKNINPDEIYNLAAQSFVGVSFEQPYTTTEINSIGVLNFLEAIKNINPKIKFYQAGTSELYGKVQEIPQNENTPFYPRSPYAVSKLYSHWLTINYRESYGIFASNGILFNHESPLRGLEFVTRKITNSVAQINLKKISHVELGNLDSKRDWGFAKEYIEGMWGILQHDKPDNFILATNITSTVRDFCKLAFNVIGVDIDFEGKGIKEIGFDKKSGKILIKVNKKYYRPAEVDILIGDYSKAKKLLKWEPRTKLEKLAEIMVEADIKRNISDQVF